MATRPGADDASTEGGDADTTAVIAESADAAAPAVEWAPAEPAPKKRRLWLWIGVPAGLAVAGLVASSLILIAPGTAVAGVPVGGLTAGAAADALASRFAATTIVLSGEGGDAELTAADLSASIDARSLADEAFADHPMWNVGAWNADPADAVVSIDPAKATAALRKAAPGLYADPVDAAVSFDPATASYVTTPSVEGIGVDVEAVRAALQRAFAAGESSVEFDVVQAPVAPETPTAVADATVATLNKILDSAGFYVGTERTVPIDRATAASWITVSPAEHGTFEITADASKIQPVVDGLPGAVDRAPVDSTVITNASGSVLSTPTVGVTGRTLESTAGIANAYAKQLAEGTGVFQLPVKEVAFATTSLARLLEVDLSEQRLYLKENGNVVDSWPISSGVGNTPTYTGHYTIGYKTTVQTMSGYNRDAEGNITGTYSTPNVKWPMYFNGGQAFHGVYWHNNFGNRMSHGCVGMPEWRAKQIYDWAPKGADVWIHQ
nr:L,D-transpeptidase family protein [Microbacterium ulmi]